MHKSIMFDSIQSNMYSIHVWYKIEAYNVNRPFYEHYSGISII